MNTRTKYKINNIYFRLWTKKYHADIGQVLHEGKYIKLF